MIDPKTLEQISAAIDSALPPQVGSDIKKNLRAALMSVLNRLDLVTREEVEVQEAVLARTRSQLQELEKKITALEERLEKK